MDRCIALSLCLSVLPCFSFFFFFFFPVVVLNQTKSNAPALRFPKQVFSLGYFWLPLKALLELEYWFGSHLENKQYIQCVFRERKTQVLITVYPTPSPCPPPPLFFFIISFNQINALTPPTLSSAWHLQQWDEILPHAGGGLRWRREAQLP